VIKSKMNQIGNAYNPNQSNRVKALCVCSAGLLRSTTIASILNERGYNVRNCGMVEEYALVPISTALVEWADEIHIVEEQYVSLKDQLHEHGVIFDDDKIFTYNLPDVFEAFDPDLVSIINKELDEREQT